MIQFWPPGLLGFYNSWSCPVLPPKWWLFLCTLALLAASTLVDTPKQIQFLMQYLKNDPRKAVRRPTIQDLKFLANKTLQTWSRENIQALCECALWTHDSLNISLGCFLSFPHYQGASPADTAQHSSKKCGFFPQILWLSQINQECCDHNNRGIAAHGVRVLTDITVFAKRRSFGHWSKILTLAWNLF